MENTIGLSVLTNSNLRQSEIAHQLLKIIFTDGKEFSPNRFDEGKRWLRIHPDNLDEFAERWPRNINILMRRDNKYMSEVAIQMGFAASGGYNNLHIWVEEDYFASQSHIEDFLQMSIKIYNLLHPEYGSIHQTRDAILLSTIHDPKYGETVVPTDLRKGLPGVYWANFFGPQFADKIGKGRLLSTPSERAEELLDGGILIVTSQSPLEPSAEVNRARQNEARKHIGEKNFSRWSFRNNIPTSKNNKQRMHNI